MRTHQKRIAAMLLFSLIFTFLFGCGNSGQSASSLTDSGQTIDTTKTPVSDGQSEQAESVEASNLETESAVEQSTEDATSAQKTTLVNYPLVDSTQTLTLWTTFPPPMSDALNGDVSQMYVYKVAANFTNIKLDITVVTHETANEQFSLNSAANAWTDFIYGVSSYTNSLEGAVDDEIIIDLKDYLEENAPDYTALLNEHPDFKKEVTLDSGIIPAIYGMEDISTVVSGPQIRKDFLDAVGMEIPGTLTELEKVLLAFKNKLDIKYPIYSSALNSMVFSAIITSAYGSNSFYVGDNDEIICGWLQDDYRDMVALMHDWYTKGIITSDTLTLTGTESTIQGGQTAVWCNNIKTMSRTAEEATTDPNCDIVAMPYITVDTDGTAYVQAKEFASDPFSISTNCEDPALAVRYLNFFFTEEGQIACNYGIEGDSFVYDENSQPIYTDLVMNNPDGLDTTVAQAIYSSFSVPYVHMASRTTSSYTDQDEFDASEIWSQHVDYSRTYKGDLTVDETAEYSASMADIETYIDETIPKYIIGDLDMAQWDDFTAQIIAMGIEDALALKQAAYDRYLLR